MSTLKVINEGETVDLRSHSATPAYDTFRLLWRRKWMIAAVVAVSLGLAAAALTRMGPRYSSEAIIQLNFSRVDAERATGSVPIDAAALVDTAANMVRSRAAADTVVERLGLDKDQRYTHQSFLSQMASILRAYLGLREVGLTPRELAVVAVMRQVRVANDSRSYLVSVSATSDSPENAARIANAVASEYLRGQAVQEVADARAAAGREVAGAALTYGTRHPDYLRARARLQQLQARLATIQKVTGEDEVVELASARSLIAAREVSTPSGPNVPMMLTLAAIAGLAVGVWLARSFTRPAGELHG